MKGLGLLLKKILLSLYLSLIIIIYYIINLNGIIMSFKFLLFCIMLPEKVDNKSIFYHLIYHYHKILAGHFVFSVAHNYHP